jgi:hypothetical protein
MIPLCQQCGKKLYKNPYYNCRGHHSTAVMRISSNLEQKRDALFHSQSCFYEWVQSHRDDLERMIRSRGEWKS